MSALFFLFFPRRGYVTLVPFRHLPLTHLVLPLLDSRQSALPPLWLSFPQLAYKLGINPLRDWTMATDEAHSTKFTIKGLKSGASYYTKASLSELIGELMTDERLIDGLLVNILENRLVHFSI